MYAQLGQIQFEGLKAFRTLERSFAARYAEMPRIGDKSTLQRTGNELDQLSFELRLHVGFSDLQADLDTLKEYKTNGEVLPLTTGAGTFMGNFVIQRIAQSDETHDLQGEPVSIVLTVELTEFVDPNPEQSARLQAAQAGFATDPARVIPIAVSRLGSTAQAATVQSISTTNLNSMAAVADIKKTAVVPAQKPALFSAAGERMKRAVAAANDAIQKLQDFQSLTAKAPALLATMEDVRDNAVLLQTRIQEGDLTNAITQGEAMTASLESVPEASMPLVTALILREP